ncbi:MAG: sigma-54 dependent transcriptional regulator [Verrucomicrobiaceae bacterium]|nr:sigma-54 dependent transcriptional regulator [Verrucomicrobiaceae bacterium]
MNVLIIEDEHALAAALATIVRRLGAEPAVAASGAGGIDKFSRRAFDLIVLDIGLPDMSGLDVLRRIRAQASGSPPVLVITAHGTLENALEARRLGASDYFLKPLDLAEFHQALRSFLKTHEGDSPAARQKKRDGTPQTTVMIGASPGMQRAFADIAQACGTDAPVLITGPSGAGKSLAARVVHANSAATAGGPFVAFRVDEWSPEQIQNTLLGEADTPPGLLRKAVGGTLFIEDIASLPPPAQGGLERALNAPSPSPGLPRILAATSRDLFAEVREGRFREDLYYRLKIVEIALPPLAERTGDIPALAAFFLGQSAGSGREIALAEETLACLKAHSWPGNVRELRNAMQHAAAVCTGPLVLPRHLPGSISRATDADAASRSHLDQALQQALARWLDQKLTAPDDALPAYDDLAGQIESMMLRELLPRFDHKPTRLAAALNMNRATLRRKCRDLVDSSAG